MWIWPFRRVDSVVLVFCTKFGSNICYSHWDWRTYASDIHLMTSRELTSGFDFWSRGHLRVAVMHRSDPQKALPWTERRVLSPHWSRSDVQCDLWPWQRNQKKRKKRHPRQWQTGYSPRPPTSPYRRQSLHAGWSPMFSSIFQVLLKSVQWFWSCGWSKIALPHHFGQWLIQQLVLPYKPWYSVLILVLVCEGQL